MEVEAVVVDELSEVVLVDELSVLAEVLDDELSVLIASVGEVKLRIISVVVMAAVVVVSEAIEETLLLLLGTEVIVELDSETEVFIADEIVLGTTVLVDVDSAMVEFCAEIPPLQAGTWSWLLHKLPLTS